MPNPAIAGIESRIYFIRDQKVLLDSDLAVLYGVETRVLIKLPGETKIVFLPISCSNYLKTNGIF